MFQMVLIALVIFLIYYFIYFNKIDYHYNNQQNVNLYSKTYHHEKIMCFIRIPTSFFLFEE